MEERERVAETKKPPELEQRSVSGGLFFSGAKNEGVVIPRSANFS